MKIHHLEYTDGGILDMDDLLNELVEDKDRVRKRTWCFVKAGFFFFLPSSAPALLDLFCLCEKNDRMSECEINKGSLRSNMVR